MRKVSGMKTPQQLSLQAIEEFKAIYQDEFGKSLSDEEVQEIVEFLKRNGPPQYAQSVQQQIDRDSREDDEDGEEGDDDLGETHYFN